MNQPEISLREIIDSDLEHFFQHQLETEANLMAAFTSRDPTDKTAFMAHWTPIRNNEAIIIRTILHQGDIAGYILSYIQAGEREISYWIGKTYWGKGIATQALSAYLSLVTERPLVARVAKANIGSRRVLEKCGFKIIGEGKGFAHAHGKEIEEYTLKLS